jgi:hypothetical protein
MDEEQVHYAQLIETNKKSLRILEKQRAIFGILTHPSIVLQIEYYEEEISKYQEKLRAAASEQTSSHSRSTSYKRNLRAAMRRRQAIGRKRNMARRKQQLSSGLAFYVETFSESNTAQQILFHIRSNLSQNIASRSVHEKTVDTITLVLLLRSIEHIWFSGQTRLGNQGLIGLTESLRVYAQESMVPKPPPDAVDKNYLRQVYAALFTVLQHTVPPPVEPPSEQSSDPFDELLISLTEAWIQLPKEDGESKCVDILHALPIVSRSRLLRALDIMTPAICLFHPDVVDEIAVVAQRIVDLFP